MDVTNVGLPSAISELLHRNRDTSANLLSGHSWWQRRIRKIHSLGSRPNSRIRVMSSPPLAFAWRHLRNSFAESCEPIIIDISGLTTGGKSVTRGQVPLERESLTSQQQSAQGCRKHVTWEEPRSLLPPENSIRGYSHSFASANDARVRLQQYKRT